MCARVRPRARQNIFFRTFLGSNPKFELGGSLINALSKLETWFCDIFTQLLWKCMNFETLRALEKWCFLDQHSGLVNTKETSFVSKHQFVNILHIGNSSLHIFLWNWKFIQLRISCGLYPFKKTQRFLKKNENAYEIRRKRTGLCPGVILVNSK